MICKSLDQQKLKVIDLPMVQVVFHLETIEKYLQLCLGTLLGKTICNSLIISTLGNRVNITFRSFNRSQLTETNICNIYQYCRKYRCNF